jgi:hypothetical protein
LEIAEEKASKEKCQLQLQCSTAIQEKHQLLQEKRQLEFNNRSLLSDKERLVGEKEQILEEKQRLDQKIEALSLDQIRSCSRTYVKKLEDCTKNQMSTGVNRKYLAEKLADVVRVQAYGGLCGNHLHNPYCQEIQASNPYRDAMDICRVMDLGSGQLNISGIEMLRKGIEGNEHGKVK